MNFPRYVCLTLCYFWAFFVLIGFAISFVCLFIQPVIPQFAEFVAFELCYNGFMILFMVYSWMKYQLYCKADNVKLSILEFDFAIITYIPTLNCFIVSIATLLKMRFYPWFLFGALNIAFVIIALLMVLLCGFISCVQKLKGKSDTDETPLLSKLEIKTVQ